MDKKSLSPSSTLHKLYKEFNNNSFDQDLYITVFYAIIDLENNSILFSNAGHNVSPVIFNSERFELMRTPGIPISNWLDSPSYIDKQTPLLKGDRIFFYTDGIIEIRNSLNEQYGEERLLEILLKNEAEPSVALKRLLDSACEFAGISNTSQIPDDITIALLQII
jgi:sigma-B regulation protein RsbU (phosphoserine phosphatase)